MNESSRERSAVMPPPKLMTTEEVAAHLGYTGDRARQTATNQLRRWGLEPYDREPGRSGQHRWRAADVRTAMSTAPRVSQHLDSRVMAVADQLDRAGQADTAEALRAHMAAIRETMRGVDSNDSLPDDLRAVAEHADTALRIVAAHLGVDLDR